MWELRDLLLVFVLAFLMSICLFVAWWILWGQSAAEARALRKKFIKLGKVEGKRLLEIEYVVGRHYGWKTVGENQFRYSWRTHKYYVTLNFRGEVCEGIESETWV